MFKRISDQWTLEKPLFPNHMSFLIGPRQCGKTTTIKNYLDSRGLESSLHYYNWDSLKTRQLFRKNPDFFIQALQQSNEKVPIAFDEIHKVRHWKRLLKGWYDEFNKQCFFVVSGSGRLDLFQKGGDSLAGRYDPYHLFPLTPGEIEGNFPIDQIGFSELLDQTPVKNSVVNQWEILGGFPEPFLLGSNQKAQKWWDQYVIRVTQEDVRDLTKIEHLDTLQLLVSMLPERIGSPLSINSLREDIEVSFATVKNYIRILNQLFLIFEVPPYSKKIHRAVKKEKKVYFYNHAAIENQGARFENMVALTLFKWVTQAKDRGLGRWELCYLRDQDRHEVDFLITLDAKPKLLIEAKVSQVEFSRSLEYFSAKLGVPGIQVSLNTGRSFKKGHLAQMSFSLFCAGLG